MPIENVDHIFAPLLRESPLDTDLLRTALRIARDIRLDDADLASSIVPESGWYLPSHSLRHLIRADITDDEARAEMTRQKSFLRRLSDLLPAVLRFFHFESAEEIRSALLCIDDCRHDFPIIAKNPRKDRGRREALDALSTALRSTQTSISALQAASAAITALVEVEFERAHELYYQKISGPKGRPKYSYSSFLRDLAICRSALELVLFRSKEEEGYLFVSSNQSRTEVVEYAYTMCRFWKGPALVTTPGSDFSALCSLLYEIASGIRDESLAGSINRFARSAERKEADEYDIEEGPENKERLEADNFRASKTAASTAMAMARKYTNIFKATNFDDDTKHLILLQAEHQLEIAEKERSKYGPNLVWASQMPLDHDFERLRQASDDLAAASRLLDIDTGVRRRRDRKLT